MCRNRKKKINLSFLIPALSILCGFILWEELVKISDYPPFILPAPSAILARFVSSLQSGVLIYHAGITFYEMTSGLALGSCAALLTGYLIAHSPLAEKILYPYIVASQAIPIAAIAPLLIIWFGSGLLPKILICSLTVYFPILINVLIGYRNLTRNFRDLFISMKADRLMILRYLEIPGTLPAILGGLRISATLSVIGAVVGELAGADAGLGYLMNVARGQFDTAMVFVTVITLMLMAMAWYTLVILLEKKILLWNGEEK